MISEQTYRVARAIKRLHEVRALGIEAELEQSSRLNCALIIGETWAWNDRELVNYLSHRMDSSIQSYIQRLNTTSYVPQGDIYTELP